MNWNTWSDFFAMGGYAIYVWGALGAVAVCLALEIAGVKARWRSAHAHSALLNRNGKANDEAAS